MMMTRVATALVAVMAVIASGSGIQTGSDIGMNMNMNIMNSQALAQGSQTQPGPQQNAQAGSAKFVTYIDRMNQWWPPSAIAAGLGLPGYATNSSYNVINLAFWTSSGPVDMALVWSDLYKYVSSQNPWGSSTAEVQRAWLTMYHSRGIKLMVSAFGATDFPTTGGADPTSTCTDLANFVITNQLDGVDLDYEDNDAMNEGKGEEWLISCMKTLRGMLPQDKYLITHAPQAPYFMGPPKYPGGGYVYVDQKVGSLVDWYNIQFYNQISSDYATFDTLFKTSDGWATDTSVMQIAAKGVPLSRLVVGKPVTTGDASNTGYVPVDTLTQIFKEATSTTSWATGVMGWQFVSDDGGKWVDSLATAF